MSEMLLHLQTVSNVIAVGTSHGLALVFGKHVSVLCAVVVKLIKGTTVEFILDFQKGCCMFNHNSLPEALFF